MSVQRTDILSNKYEAFRDEQNPELQKMLRFDILSILNDLETLSSEDLYIWGLTYYMSDDNKEHHTKLALEKFHRAFSIDSDHFLACLYIAHCYHDLREFKEALNYYQLVDQSKLQEFQLWRYVKLIEQIGFCHFQLGDQQMGRSLFLEVLDWYRKTPKDEVLAVPTEMLQCLPETDEIIQEMKQLNDYLNE